jgi:hypothetical protein
MQVVACLAHGLYTLSQALGGYKIVLLGNMGDLSTIIAAKSHFDYV